jgi:hypothetical protein
MNSAVVAAVIAASVSLLTLIGTLAAQYLGRRSTSRELDRTLAEQRTRTLNERFATAAEQLGGDKPPAVQLAGAYAMAGLADDWKDQRQTCINVLCGYLRMPYEPDPGPDAPAPERLAFTRNRVVRHAIIQVIRDHLNPRIGVASWQDCHFDFEGVVFDGGNFAGIEVPSTCYLNFLDARFVAGTTSFAQARLMGGIVNFWRMEFAGGEVLFHGVDFAAGEVAFGDCSFNGGKVDFSSIETNEGPYHVAFSGADVTFMRCRFTDGEVSFARTEFTGGKVDFARAEFTGAKVNFKSAHFAGGNVSFATVANWSRPPLELPPSAPGLVLPEPES